MAREHTYTPRRIFTILSNGHNANGDAHLVIELPAFRDEPELLERLCDGERPQLRYRVSRNGADILSGEIDAADMRFELTLDRTAHPSGVYTVQIEAAGCDGTLWEQDIFAQHRTRLSPGEIDALAREHAPVFIFSARDEYYPVSLSELFTSHKVRNSETSLSIETITGTEEVPASALGEFMLHNGNRNYLLNFSFFSMDDSPFRNIHGSPDAATVYYSYLEEENGSRFFINYHLFFAFDTKAGFSKLTGIGPHNFDRESMTIVFGADRKPESLVISGHLEDQKIFFLEKLKFWTEGRVNVDYHDKRTLKLGAHPVIAVAEGSHALYPLCGVYTVLSLLNELAGFVAPEFLPLFNFDLEEAVGSITSRQVLLPPALPSSVKPCYDLKSAAFGTMTSEIDPAHPDDDAAYLVFSGYWVDVAGPQNAKFPPFTRKESDINGWVNHAYNWDWDDIPERLFRNNEVIRNFILSLLANPLEQKNG